MAQEPVFTLGELANIECDADQKFALHVDRILSQEQINQIIDQWNLFLPGRQLIVFQKGMRLCLVNENMNIVSDSKGHF